MALIATQVGVPQATTGADMVTVTVSLRVTSTTDQEWAFDATASAQINPGQATWEAQLRAQLMAAIDARWAEARRAWTRHVYCTQTLGPQVDTYLAGLE